MIRDARGNGRGRAEGLVEAAEVVVQEMQADGGGVVLDLLY